MECFECCKPPHHFKYFDGFCEADIYECKLSECNQEFTNFPNIKRHVTRHKPIQFSETKPTKKSKSVILLRRQYFGESFKFVT